MGIFDRILSWVGFEVVDDEGQHDEVATAGEIAEASAAPLSRRRREVAIEPANTSDRLLDRGPDRNTERSADRANLVSFPGGSAMLRMVVFTPSDFEQVQPMADHLKNRRPVILNLEGVDKELSQRILNFLSGTIYALSGEMHRVASNVLLFAPGNVEIIYETPVERHEY